jgi:hypothetical protein
MCKALMLNVGNFIKDMFNRANVNRKDHRPQKPPYRLKEWLTMGNYLFKKMKSKKKLRFFRVSYLEKFNRLAETIVDRRRSGRSGIHCHRDNMTIGNEPLGCRLEDGEFKGETRIANFPDPGMNMENLVEKRPIAVLTERFHVEKIDPGFEEFIVPVINRFQVFSQGYIEVS